MHFKIMHDSELGYFFADVVSVDSIKPWREEHARQIAAGKSARWATTCANRVMTEVVEAEWLATDACADLFDNYPAGCWQSMSKWKKMGANRFGGSMLIKFPDSTHALRFKLSWHDRETLRVLEPAA